jgi:hypothetical protein
MSVERKRLRHQFLSCRKDFNRVVQKSKRLYWFKVQHDLLSNVDTNPETFWKSIGKVGVASKKKQSIPMEVVENGIVSRDTATVLAKWKHEFSTLYNVSSGRNESMLNDVESVNDNIPVPSQFNDPITVREVRDAIFKTKNGKSSGVDELPYEVFRNDTAVSFLHVFYNVCFQNGSIPAMWGQGIITPIHKPGSADSRDPMSYRGITLAPTMYKLYCHILNHRMTYWMEANNKLVDEQGGFRKKRSTTDHLSSLSNLVETRIKQKQSTYAAFIDFKKAYDSVDRDMLWTKLEDCGVSGKMLKAVKSLYKSVSACVRINGHLTEWFEVRSGLRQGCSLSPILFKFIHK